VKRSVVQTLIGIALAAQFVFSVQLAHAATSVGCSTTALVTAINTANSSSGTTDTLDLSANCTYTFTSANSIDATNGDSALPKITSPIIINGNGATIKRDSASTNFRLIYVSNGASLVLKNLTVTGGTLFQTGAGIYNGTGTLALINTTLSAHFSLAGGDAVSNNGGTVTVINTTVSGNGAGGTGTGALYNVSGTTTITNSTFAGNNSTAIGRNSGTVTLVNSIVWGNLSQIIGSVTATFSIVEGGYTGTGNLNKNPLFVTQVAYSLAPIASGDYHIQSGSPALDVASSADLPADTYDLDGDSNTSETLPYDRDSQARVQYSLLDMGADEADYCTAVSFPYSASTASALTTAVACANANATADTINLTGGSIYSFSEANGVTTDSALPAITSEITINGNGATIRRSGASTSFRVIYNQGGKLTLNNLTVSGGSTGSSPGGGVMNTGTLTITSSTISNNSAGTNKGGGVYNLSGTAKILNSTITGNSANLGGGLLNISGGTVAIIGSTIASNSATDSGGGLYNNSASSTITVINSAVSGNTASVYGAGIRNSNFATLTLINTTVTGNVSSGYASAVMTDNSAVTTIQNSTIAANYDPGSGVSVSNSASVTLANSIVWGNSGGLANTVSASYSLIQGGYAGTGNLNVDPLFVNALAPSSTPSTGGDYHLQSTSPAIDAGSYSALPADTYDLDGDSNTSETLPYDRDSQARVLTELDLGADEVEYCAALTFPYTAATATALKMAVTCANANASADTINLSGGTYTFTSATALDSENALPTITSALTINGNGATIERASGASANFRLIKVASTADVTLDNLTITNGGGVIRGGGVYNDNGRLTVTGSTFANNSAVVGGGLANWDTGTLTVTDSIFIENSADQGGGLVNDGRLTLTGSTFSGNTAMYGGGMTNWDDIATIVDSTFSENAATSAGGGVDSLGTLTISNSTIRGNTAGEYGGGFEADFNASSTIINTIISGNTATDDGGGVYNGATLKLLNTTIAGNSAPAGGGLQTTNGTSTVTNSILWDNGSAIGHTGSGATTATYSIIEGGYAGAGNRDADPMFVDAVPAAPSTGGDLHLQATSAAIDAGASDLSNPSLPATDLDGNARAYDLAGVNNTGSGATPYVDLGAYEARFASVSSITRSNPSAGLTNASSVTFQVVFDQSLSGIAASDFAATVVSGSLSGGSLTGVSGSGATYSVTVSTGSGDGVLRLDVLATGRAADSSGLPIGLLAYTSGESYTIDRTAPAAPIITGITTDSGQQASGSTTDPTITLNGSAEASSTLTLTRAGVGQIGTAAADGAGGWSFDYTGTTLAVGTHVFTATAADVLGSTSPSSQPFTVTVRAATVWYVDHTAAGANAGTSWADAFTRLQDALAAADNGDQIWVADGAYTPSATGNRAASFTLKAGLSVYGGFAGGETALGQRDWAANVATLSGDLNGDDAGGANTGENSEHVVTITGSATLDGFTIAGGNANGSANKGGGIASSASPTLRNLIVTGNRASDGGAGIYSNGGSPTLTNVVISGNTARYGGGLYLENSSTATLTSVAIISNTATTNGGGIYSSSSNPSLNDVTISGNTATNEGGGIYSITSTPALSNVTISGNSASSSGGGISTVSSSPTLTSVTLSDNSAGVSGGGISSRIGTLIIRNSIIWGNTADASPSAIGTSSSSPSVSYSIVEGGYIGSGNLSADPLLAALGGYGGATQTQALLLGSPAIDAADAAACPASDQRGIARPQGGGCDIGAFESRGFTLTAVSGAGQQTTPGSAFASPLVIQVAANDSGAGGAGGVLSFSAPLSGASLSSAAFSATTDLSGTASLSVTANAVEGSYVVTATARGASAPVSFALSQYGPRTLTVQTAGAGSGTVTSSPAGISCGGTCSASLAYGTVVTLTATAESGSTFSGWSGACAGSATTCQVTMSEARAVTATFPRPDAVITIFLPTIHR
jgi:hypothetical protein